MRNVLAGEEKARPFGSLIPYSLVYRERTTHSGAEPLCANAHDRMEIKGVNTNPITSIKCKNLPLYLPKQDMILSSFSHTDDFI